MANGSLMKVESIAECSTWSILQYFLPAFSNNWYRKPNFGLLRVAVLHRFLLYQYSNQFRELSFSPRWLQTRKGTKFCITKQEPNTKPATTMNNASTTTGIE